MKVRFAAFVVCVVAACRAPTKSNATSTPLPTAASVAPSANTAAAPKRMTDEEIAAAIVEASPGERTIPEAGRGSVMFTLDKLVDDAFAAADSNSASKALRFWGVRADAISGRLGLENGDTLVSVDDLRVGYTYTYTDASANSPKSTIARAWRGKGFTLKVTRAGKLVELRYRFVD